MVDFHKKLKEYQDVKDAAPSSQEDACLAGCGHSVYIHTEKGCQAEGCGCKCQVSDPTPVAEPVVDTTQDQGDSAVAPLPDPTAAEPGTTPEVPVAPPTLQEVPPPAIRKTPRAATKQAAPAPPPAPLPKPEAKLHKALTKRATGQTYQEEVAAQNKHERERTGTYRNGKPIPTKQDKAVAESLAKPVKPTQTSLLFPAVGKGSKGSTKPVQVRPPATPVKGVAKTPVLCQCGCGDTTKGGRFRPGHDARYYSALKKAGIKTNHK